MKRKTPTRAEKYEPHTEVAAQEIARLRALERDGKFTARGVLDDARDPRSPLHHFFTWDNDTAAEMLRMQQARELIVRYRVQIKTIKRTVSATIYVRDPRAPADEQGMVSIHRVMQEEDYAREVAVQEIDRAIAMLKRAAVQVEALGFGELIAPLVADAEVVRNRMAVGHRKAA